MHVAGQGAALGGAGVVPVFQGQGQAFFQGQGQALVHFVTGIAPQAGQGEQSVVVGGEGLATAGSQFFQAVQHGFGLHGVKARRGAGAAGVLEGQADVHAAAGGEAAHHFFQARLKAAHAHGQAPFEVQMAAVDAFDFPLLGEAFALYQAAAEAGHTAQHNIPLK